LASAPASRNPTGQTSTGTSHKSSLQVSNRDLSNVKFWEVVELLEEFLCEEKVKRPLRLLNL
jgi:hypothetical protein